MNIYNDYLEFLHGDSKPEPGYEVLGEANESHPNQMAFLKVKSQEDFYELFRDWEIKESNLGHYQAISQLGIDGPIKYDRNGHKIEETPNTAQLINETN